MDENHINIEEKNNCQNSIPIFLRNCQIECPEIEATITGTIPMWLKGSLIRNGPGLQKIGKYEFNHVFDFPSLLRKYRIENGRVFFENKFLKSSAFKKNQEKQRIVVTEFGTRRFPDPCQTLLQRFMSYFTVDDLFSDNTAVSFTQIGDELYASGDSPYLQKVDPNNLETIGRCDIRKCVAVNYLTSHAHIDEDGNVYNMGNSIGYYNIVKIPRQNGLKNASIVAKVPIKRRFKPSYYHSFSMTENYFVFIEQAFVVSVTTIIKQFCLKGKHSDILKWNPKYKNKFYLISRKNGKVLKQKYVSEPFVVFHTINAYEDGNNVVIDMICYNDGNIVNAMFTETLRQENDKKQYSQCIKSDARRFVLPIFNEKEEIKVGENLNSLSDSKAFSVLMKNNTIHCTPELLTEKSVRIVEMPNINYKRFNGKKYRYFYGVSQTNTVRSQLVKCDTQTKTLNYWYESNCFFSEPIFTSSPTAVEEDDGIILSSVISEVDENRGFLLILDAKTFKEIGRASITVNSELPIDFHGCFLSI